MEISTGACLEITVCGTIVVLSGFWAFLQLRGGCLYLICMFSIIGIVHSPGVRSVAKVQKKNRGEREKRKKERGEGASSSCHGEERDLDQFHVRVSRNSSDLPGEILVHRENLSKILDGQ